jgi:hypothetical protein
VGDAILGLYESADFPLPRRAKSLKGSAVWAASPSTMWRSGKFIEGETYKWHSGPAGRALELLGKETGMFKDRHESKVTLSDEELEAELRRLLAELDLSALPRKRGSWTLNFG